MKIKKYISIFTTIHVQNYVFSLKIRDSTCCKAISTLQSTPGRKALLHSSAAKWPNNRASGYPNAFIETQAAKAHCNCFLQITNVTHDQYGLSCDPCRVSHPDLTNFCLLMRNPWCLMRTLAGRELAERYAAHNRCQMAECPRQRVPKSFIYILNLNALRGV